MENAMAIAYLTNYDGMNQHMGALYGGIVDLVLNS